MNTEAEIDSTGSLSPLSRIQQLQQLEIRFPDQIICPACVEFHPIHGRLARSWYRLLNALPLVSSPSMSCSAYRCALYSGGDARGGGIKIDLLSLHLVMRSERIGPRYGLPVSALSQYANCKIYNCRNMAVLISQSRARVVDNRLILKITTRFQIGQTLENLSKYPERPDPSSWDCDKIVKPVICPHVSPEETSVRDIMKSFIDSQNTISSSQEKVLLTQSSPHCSSECIILDHRRRKGEKRQGEESTVSKNSRIFQVDRYIDFGECRAGDLKEWNALTKHGKGWEYHTHLATSPKKLWEKAEREE